MDSEAVYITKKLLFAVLIAFSIAIFCSNSLYAANDTPIGNSTNLTQEQATNDSSNYTYSNETNDPNNSTGTSGLNTTNTTETSLKAAGSDSSSEIHGVWIAANDTLNLNKTDIKNLVETGITDIFVKTNRISDPTYDIVLPYILSLVNGTGINVHAWITCFKDASGNWI
ncbi:MAG TPA: hypothetical protein VK426_06655, partial [Methanobacterium sp.]|nr:hypothetical protein [Methanobacterium sp.]